MYKVYFINMPFAELGKPSLALTQLKSVLDKKFHREVEVKIFYLNHDFSRYIGGVDLYNYTANSKEILHSGLGEWFFSRVVFPQMPDNSKEYFARYFFKKDPYTQMIKKIVCEKRAGLELFLEELIEKYSLADADLVGFTSTFVQNVASFAMARKIKEKNPDIVTVMGGANCHSPMGQEFIKRIEPIDFIFSGPALTGFSIFIRHCLGHNYAGCREINGVFFKGNSVYWQKKEPVVDSEGYTHIEDVGDESDIDEKIDLDYQSFLDMLAKEYPRGEVTPTLLFETSRGCWWGERSSCKFCGLNEKMKHYRKMTPGIALDQFKSLFKYFPGCREYRSVDNVLPKGYPGEVLQLVDRPPGAKIFYEVRPDLAEEDMAILARAGVTTVQPGIEALDTGLLKSMSKGITASRNLRFLKNCLTYGIWPNWNLLVGFPDQKEEVYEKYCHDIPLLVHLPPPAGAFQVRYDRFSYYYNHSEEFGLDLHPYDFYELVYPFDKKTLNNIAYYFADRCGTAPYVMDMHKWLAKLNPIIDTWNNRWKKGGGPVFPKLLLKKNGGTTTIYDSRGENIAEYEIDDTVGQLLEYLEQPRRIEDITSRPDQTPGIDCRKEIDFVKSKRLVFQDGDRFFNLVCFEEPLLLKGRPVME